MNEKQLRRALKKAGYRLSKSRGAFSIDNYGGYMIIDISTNFIAAGKRFDLSLEDVYNWLNS